jgi:hypothetical protein
MARCNGQQASVTALVVPNFSSQFD